MNYINNIINDDCRKHIGNLEKNTIDLLLSDIPYGICLNDWDVLHNNTNSALLGSSPAQKGKSGFKRRGKPIIGWSKADKNIGVEYEKWCDSWISLIYPIMKCGSSAFIFGGRRTLHRVINAFENSGFILKDVLAWKKPSAHYRAQKLNNILLNRGLDKEAKEWQGWRLGNLAPIYEPIAWFFKPYKKTITDNVIVNKLGAINLELCKIGGKSPTNLLEINSNENKTHEAQKPVKLMEFLINLTTKQNQVVLDPFIGSGTTAVACKNLHRNFIGFEINETYFKESINRINYENSSNR